jgi:two-component sensor histidine kinase
MSPGNRPAVHNAKAEEKRPRRPHGTLNSALLALFVGCTTFLLGVAVQVITYRYFAGTPTSAFADDLVVGVATGLVVFLYERRRKRYLLERLQIIAEMNHHVRNALQVFSFSAQLQQDEKLRTMLRESSDRIEWALREILPGKTSA